MQKKNCYDAKGRPNGNIKYLTDDGKEIAFYSPARPERWGLNRAGNMVRKQRASKECISINIQCLSREKDFRLSYIERAKPEFAEDIKKIIKMHRDAVVSEHDYL